MIAHHLCLVRPPGCVTYGNGLVQATEQDSALNTDSIQMDISQIASYENKKGITCNKVFWFWG